MPVLLGPPDGAVFGGGDALILLNWAAPGILGENEWYVLRIRPAEDDGALTDEVLTRATSFRVPQWIHEAASRGGPRTFRWDVTIVRQPSDESPTPVSPSSPARVFTWE